MTEGNETREMWRDHNRRRQRASEKRRDAAEHSFDALRVHAAKHGVLFKRHTDAHYQIAILAKGWLWNVYPGKHRIYIDNHHMATGTPRLNLPDRWTLTDVVEAAVLRTKEATDAPVARPDAI